jgi:ribosome-associated heat shock protein Hsp15
VSGEGDSQRIRLDKWLWAARFFRTRSAAAKAVNGGQVQVNGARVKPARTVNPGETVRIRRGMVEFTIRVLALSDRRKGAPEARLLYEETAESIARRERQGEERRLLATEPLPSHGRPNKKDRRLIRRFIRKGE